MDLKKHYVFGLPVLYFMILLCAVGIAATCIYEYFR